MQTGLIGVPESAHCAPSLVVWRCTARYDGAWRRSSRCNGRRSRSPGWLKSRVLQPYQDTPDISTKRSIAASSSKTRSAVKKGAVGAVAYCAADASPQEPQRARRGQGHILEMRSLYRERPAQRLRIAPCRGIGKVEIFEPKQTTRTSLPSSSAIPASRCSSRSPARTRRLLLLRLPSTSASCLRKLRRSLTWDQGKETQRPEAAPQYAHQRPGLYFCDRAVPGSAASNENTNGLLRQYLPRDNRSLAHLSELSERDCSAGSINVRERPSGFQTPADRLQSGVRLTG